MALRKLCESAEMWGWVFIVRRNSHETFNMAAKAREAVFNKVIGLCEGNAKFLRLVARIDLNKQLGKVSYLLRGLF
ncbi:hypothetical protein AA15669_0786 [Saccharibacter floricola DSM 15669]|uniref:Transposase n=1 Tax=Saccharibacter floricola DSM 15669 TaxID=1123227 RepID=A0ABQ0NXV0_9PROT|nr:hypothetical protein AA15669_0786 [Saccharibacter floricola DSM 15669]